MRAIRSAIQSMTPGLDPLAAAAACRPCSSCIPICTKFAGGRSGTGMSTGGYGIA